jgi:hypothetical protein
VAASLVGGLLVLGLTACTTARPAVTSPAGGQTPDARPSTSSTPTPTPTPPAPVEAVLVVAGVDVDGEHVSASGYVQGLVEQGKPCTFVFTGLGMTVRAEHTSSADRMTTSCGTVRVPIDQFVRGSWSVTLSYETKGGTVTSAPSALEIP